MPKIAPVNTTVQVVEYQGIGKMVTAVGDVAAGFQDTRNDFNFPASARFTTMAVQLTALEIAAAGFSFSNISVVQDATTLVCTVYFDLGVNGGAKVGKVGFIFIGAT